MSNKQALRELQSRLAERLQASRDQAQAASWLAVEAGGQGFLLPLAQAGEIFSGSLAPVPVAHTSRWFLGIANLRGHLHGVVDLAGFLGLKRSASLADVPGRDSTCLVAFNSNLDINCALLVDRLAGLRSREQLTGEALPPRRPAYLSGIWRDGQGRRWCELGLATLAGQESFLKVFE